MKCARSLMSLTSVVVLMAVVGCQQPPASEPSSSIPATPPAPPAQPPAERGKYLVSMGGCNDCHTPKVFTSGLPEQDPARLLSGHPASEKLPAVPSGVIGPDKWGAIANNHFTAWAGPWGVSFTKNLTPDRETGLGSWTEEMFIKAIRTGKHQGEGRAILPPMPWPEYAKMTDDDLKAIFAYLQTLPPIKNPVPEPIPPPQGRSECVAQPRSGRDCPSSSLAPHAAGRSRRRTRPARRRSCQSRARIPRQARSGASSASAAPFPRLRYSRLRRTRRSAGPKCP